MGWGFLRDPWTRLVAWFVGGLVLVYLLFPTVVVIPVSLTPVSFLQFPPASLSLRWYRALFSEPQWIRAASTSLKVAVLTTAIATILGTTAALGLARGNFRGQAALYALVLSPLVVPGIVIAISVYRLYSELHLIGSIVGLSFAHTILALPLVIVNVSAALQVYDPTLDRAALSLGASPVYAFLRVKMPLIAPGIISGALFAFLTSFDELVIALFISGVSARTLPIQMWDGIRYEVTPIIAAASTLLLLLSATVLSVAASMQAIVRRRAQRGG